MERKLNQKLEQEKIMNRKYKTVLAITIIIIFGLVILFFSFKDEKIQKVQVLKKFDVKQKRLLH